MDPRSSGYLLRKGVIILLFLLFTIRMINTCIVVICLVSNPVDSKFIAHKVLRESISVNEQVTLSDI